MFVLTLILVLSAALHYFMLKCRYWIIRRLAGKRTIIINATMKRGTLYVKPDDQVFISDSRFEDLADGFIKMT